MTTRRAEPRLAKVGGRAVSYAFRPWKIGTYAGRRGTTCSLRRTVADAELTETFTARVLADSRRAELVTAARTGAPFDIQMGMPVTEVGQVSERTWYEHATGYVYRRWGSRTDNSRQSIAETRLRDLEREHVEDLPAAIVESVSDGAIAGSFGSVTAGSRG